MRTPGDHKKIIRNHQDDMFAIWTCAGSKPFYSADITPSIHGKTLEMYKDRGYLTSTRPMKGKDQTRRIWQIAGCVLLNCRERFGPEPEGKNREEKVVAV